MPKVSVIVPVYNTEKYLKKCLETLVNQTMEEIEIIIVNDGTKDNSMTIAREFAKKYPEKIVILEKENGGLSDARNYAIPYAKGEYIAFLDSDDYVEINMYEDMYNLAKSENCDMVECNFYWEYPKKTKEDIGTIYHNKREMLEKIRVVAWNKLIKREILEQTKIRFPVGYRYEDVEFTYKLIPYIEKSLILPKTLVHYVQREDSISNSQNEKTKDIFKLLDNVIEFYKEKRLYAEYYEELEYTYTRFLFCSSLLRMVKIKDKNVKKDLLNKTWENVNINFPNWKKNSILKKNKSGKNFYMKTLNKLTYKIYCTIFGWRG